MSGLFRISSFKMDLNQYEGNKTGHTEFFAWPVSHDNIAEELELHLETINFYILVLFIS